MHHMDHPYPHSQFLKFQDLIKRPDCKANFWIEYGYRSKSGLNRPLPKNQFQKYFLQNKILQKVGQQNFVKDMFR